MRNDLRAQAAFLNAVGIGGGVPRMGWRQYFRSNVSSIVENEVWVKLATFYG